MDTKAISNLRSMIHEQPLAVYQVNTATGKVAFEDEYIWIASNTYNMKMGNANITPKQNFGVRKIPWSPSASIQPSPWWTQSIPANNIVYKEYLYNGAIKLDKRVTIELHHFHRDNLLWFDETELVQDRHLFQTLRHPLYSSTIVAGGGKWKKRTLYNKLMQCALRSVKHGPFSVVDKVVDESILSVDIDEHDYLSIAPYYWPVRNTSCLVYVLYKWLSLVLMLILHI